MSQPLRILVIAEAANPEWVSVPLVGWSLTEALRASADVHLVTHVRNQGAIERAGLGAGVDFTAINNERIAKPLHQLSQIARMGTNKGWTIASAINGLAYPYFEYLVWRQFGEAIRRKEYDIVHRITPLTPTVSSSLATHCRHAGVPFVIGPINGGVPWPKEFRREQAREKEWLASVRGAYKLKPGRMKSLRNTSAIIVGSEYTRTEIPPAHRGKTVYIPENAIDPGKFHKHGERQRRGKLHACFVGRLVPYKGPDIVIEAVAPMLKQQTLHLTVAGDGPLRGMLKAMCAELGVTEQVTFLGNVPHESVQDVMVDCDVLAFPSIREFGGGVVLEAMALGVVPVVVDYAGPSELVTAECGIKIPLGPRQCIVDSLRETIEGLVADRSCLARAVGRRESQGQYILYLGTKGEPDYRGLQVGYGRRQPSCAAAF